MKKGKKRRREMKEIELLAYRERKRNKKKRKCLLATRKEFLSPAVFKESVEI